ncbi:MAG TPA: CNNM domain-containing protein [Actinophytocola sp.]|nr:CNNM domain-containing protein [Actinophytocola sp.]
MTETSLSIALIVLFVLIGGYFSAAELALVSLREGQLSRFAEQGGRAMRVAKLRENPNRFLSAVQIGITFAGFFSAAYGGSTLAGPLTVALIGLGVPQGPADVAALVTVTCAISYLSLVLGELVPKRLALQRSEAVALFAAPVPRPDRDSVPSGDLAALRLDERPRTAARPRPTGRRRADHRGRAARPGRHGRRAARIAVTPEAAGSG